MYILQKLLLSLLALAFLPDVAKPADSIKMTKQCNRFCFRLVEPLLLKVYEVKSKEKQFNNVSDTITKLKSTIGSLESQRALTNAHQKHCLTKEELLGDIQEVILTNKDKELSDLKSKGIENVATIKDLENKMDKMAMEIESKDKIVEQINVVLKNKDSEILKLKTESAIYVAKIKEFESKINQIESINSSFIGKQSNVSEIKVPGSSPFNVSWDSTQDLENKTDKIAMVIQSRNNIIEQVNVEQKNTDSAILKLKTENAIDVAKTREIESIGKQSNIVEIKLPGSSPFNVSCDSTLVDSGWTVIQRRQDGSEKFDRTMKDYQSGFGKPTGEFFMGLNKIHLLTQYKQHELYIYLKNFNNEVRYARYSDFLIGGEEENFKLKSLGEYSGDAGDAMVHHLNMQFSTLDADHDNWGTGNCAEWLHSGWWFDKCGKCNLNGLYRAENHMYEKWGVNWFSWTNTSLKFVQMMIRPKVKL